MNVFTFRRILSCLVLFFTIHTFQLQANNAEEDFIEIWCPGDKWVACDAEIWDLDIYGHARYKDYSGWHTLKNPEEHYHLNSCNTGHIERKWKYKDPYTGYWHSCSQTIHVGGGSSTVQIEWPKQNLELHGCNPSTDPEDLPYGYQYPWYNQKDCQMIVRSFKDKTFYFEEGCKKIIRSWTIIDWCSYKPNSYPVKGYYEWDQVIKIFNDEEPAIWYPVEGVTGSSEDCETTHIDVPKVTVKDGSCDADVLITNNSPYALNDGPDASGHYPVGMTLVTYKVQYGCGQEKFFTTKITVENNVSPVPICISGLSVALMPVDDDGDGIPEDGMAVIWAKDYDASSYHPCGNPLTFSFDPNELVMFMEFSCADVGANTVTLYTNDDRGNQSSCTVTLFVQNNSANIPDCVAQESEDGETEEEETDGEEEDPDDEEHDYGDDMENDDDESEDDDDTDTEEGEHESDEMEEDSMSYTILSGHVSTFYGLPLAEAAVAIEGESSSIETEEVLIDSVLQSTIVDSFINDFGQLFYITEFEWEYIYESIETASNDAFSSMALSQETGTYEIKDIPMGQMATIQSSPTERMSMENINTDDGVLLFEHLTGTKRIDNEYALLAADVDGNGTLDFSDLELLVGFINGEVDALPASGWIFMNMDRMAEEGEDADLRNINSNEFMLDLDAFQQDYMVIQIGDIGQLEVEARSNERLSDLQKDITAYLQNVEKGTIVNINPNPFTNEFVLQYHSVATQQAELELLTIDGKLISKQFFLLEKGMNQRNIRVDDAYQGTIFYRMVAGQNQVVGKILKL